MYAVVSFHSSYPATSVRSIWYLTSLGGTASLARRLYIRQGTGVGAFAKVYGTKQRRGTLPGHFAKASRGIIRSCLKQLEKVII